MVLTTTKEVLLFALRHVGLELPTSSPPTLSPKKLNTKVKQHNTSTQLETNTHVMPARQTTNTTQPEKSTKVEQQNQTTEKLNGTTKDSHHTTQKTEKLSSATQTKSGEENSDSTKKDSKQKSNSPSTETKTNTKPKVPVPPGSSVFPAHLFQNLTFIPGFLPFNFANLYPIKPTTSQNGQQQGKDSKDNADNKGGFNSTVINPLLIQLANNAAVKKASDYYLKTNINASTAGPESRFKVTLDNTYSK